MGKKRKGPTTILSTANPLEMSSHDRLKIIGCKKFILIRRKLEWLY